MEGYYTRKAAAARLGITTVTLDHERARGAIAFVQRGPGCKVFFSETAIQEYLARHTHPVTPEPVTRETYRHRRRREVSA